VFLFNAFFFLYEDHDETCFGNTGIIYLKWTFMKHHCENFIKKRRTRSLLKSIYVLLFNQLWNLYSVSIS
jgi:hypothetical protein